MIELVPICPLEVDHDTLTEQDCWSCGLIQALWSIATGESEDPATEAMTALDESVEYRPK